MKRFKRRTEKNKNIQKIWQIKMKLNKKVNPLDNGLSISTQKMNRKN
jgi:hypothetical protein